MHWHVIERIRGGKYEMSRPLSSRPLAEIAKHLYTQLEMLRAKHADTAYTVFECALPGDNFDDCADQLFTAADRTQATIVEIAHMGHHRGETGVPMMSIVCRVQDDKGYTWWIDGSLPATAIPHDLAVGDQVVIDGLQRMNEVKPTMIRRLNEKGVAAWIPAKAA